MNTWRDPEKWQRWLKGEDCPICRNVVTEPAVAELEVSRLMMSADAPMRVYAWLPTRRHVIELHELADSEGAAFMRDIQTASQAILKHSGAIKMNYEIHGNTVPHLHVHLFPRYIGDPFEGRPIDPKTIQHPVYGEGEFETLVRLVQSDIAARAARDPA